MINIVHLWKISSGHFFSVGSGELVDFPLVWTLFIAGVMACHAILTREYTFRGSYLPQSHSKKNPWLMAWSLRLSQFIGPHQSGVQWAPGGCAILICQEACRVEYHGAQGARPALYLDDQAFEGVLILTCMALSRYTEAGQGICERPRVFCTDSVS